MSDTKPLITGPQGGVDPSGAQTGTSGKSRLTGFNVYTGVISAVDLVTRKIDVLVDKVHIMGCIYAPGALATYMGFTDVTLPPVGASVLVMYMPQTSYVIGTQPLTTASTKAFSGTVTGDLQRVTADKDAYKSKHTGEQSETAPGYAAPRDMLPGEKSIENGLGIALRLMFNFAQLTAGDLAKVEVHMLNDMVRIVDNYFVHHSVGGDELIWSNGRCNHESHFTSYQHEADGKLAEGDEFATKIGTGVFDPKESTKSPYGDTGRWRKSTYVGFLGDLIHTFVTDPTTAESTIGAEAERAGKFRAWVGADGMVMVQSVAGVLVQVTSRVVAPTIRGAWNDPKIDSIKEIEDLDKSFLKMWGTGPDWKDLKVACWQMRSYARYITLYHSLARFKQLEKKKRCSIPTEKECPAPSPTCHEKDKEEVNPTNGDPMEGAATFCMDPMGSISLISGTTASVIISRGGMQLSAGGNIEINAGGSISLTGKNVYVKGVNHVEISAIAGALYLKSRTAWNALCELGRVWLKSDAKPNYEENLSKAKSSNPSDAPVINPESGNFGVVIDSTQSQTLIHGYKGVVMGSTGPEAPVRVQATGPKSDLIAVSKSRIKMFATGNILMKASKFAVSAALSKIVSTVIKLGDNVRIIKAGIDVAGFVRANNMTTLRGYMGPSDKVSKWRKPEDATPVVSHEETDKVGKEAEALQDNDLTFQIMEAELNNYKWEYRNWRLNPDITKYNNLKASPFYDALYLDKALRDEFYTIPWVKCRLIPGQPRTRSDRMPWPGMGAKLFEFTKRDTPHLTERLDRQFDSSMIATIGDMEAKDFKIHINK